MEEITPYSARAYLTITDYSQRYVLLTTTFTYVITGGVCVSVQYIQTLPRSMAITLVRSSPMVVNILSIVLLAARAAAASSSDLNNALESVTMFCIVTIKYKKKTVTGTIIRIIELD